MLERALGPGGRAVFADAYAIASCWWNVPGLNPPAWRARRRLLGHAGRDELRVAPLVFYPEAVRLAQVLAVRERRRLRRTLTRDDDRAWLAGAAVLLDEWGIPAVPGLDVVEAWAGRHPLLPKPKRGSRAGGAAARPARGRYRRLPLPAPHTDQLLDTTLGDRSCLPWKLGDLITTELTPVPGGWTLGGRA